MSHKNSLKNSLYLFFSTLFIESSRFIKLSFIVGSYSSFFSAVNVIAPMVGVFSGIYKSLMLLVALSLVKFSFLGGTAISILGYHIPHFFASFYWNARSKLAKMLIPSLCMVLFIAHPVGQKAFPYALLWLIPIFIALFNSRNIFLRALGSTFTAHAIGSVIYLFGLSMAPEIWIGLIPKAIVERLIFASGMVIVYYSYVAAKSYLAKKTTSLKSKNCLQQI